MEDLQPNFEKTPIPIRVSPFLNSTSAIREVETAKDVPKEKRNDETTLPVFSVEDSDLVDIDSDYVYTDIPNPFYEVHKRRPVWNGQFI